ncbi:unnamed protein product [Urochloa humidicola]
MGGRTAATLRQARRPQEGAHGGGAPASPEAHGRRPGESVHMEELGQRSSGFGREHWSSSMAALQPGAVDGVRRSDGGKPATRRRAGRQRELWDVVDG